MVIKNKKAPAAVTTEPPRPRVRRGNAEDAERLRGELLQAAATLFAEGGLEAVTMRGVAAQVGVSAMTPYRYFADKVELLSGLWQVVMQGLHDRLTAEINRHTGGRERLRASIDAFLSYWEDHPDRYRLVYMTERTAQRESKSAFSAAPIYGRILQLTYDLTAGLAAELGLGAARVRVASDVRFTMTLGYLHAVLITHRYPWADEAGLRTLYIDEVMATTERCLRHADAPGPQLNPSPDGTLRSR